MLDLFAHVLLAALAIAHAHSIILKELIVLVLLLLLVFLIFFVIFTTETFKNEIDEDSLRDKAEFSERSHVEILVLKDELD
jgi:uncharacterized membrane protein